MYYENVKELCERILVTRLLRSCYLRGEGAC